MTTMRHDRIIYQSIQAVIGRTKPNNITFTFDYVSSSLTRSLSHVTISQSSRRKGKSIIIRRNVRAIQRTASLSREAKCAHHTHPSLSLSSLTPFPFNHPTPTFATPFHFSTLFFLLNRYCRSLVLSSLSFNGPSPDAPSPPSSMSSRTSASRNPNADAAPRLDRAELTRCRVGGRDPIVSFDLTRRRRSWRSAASPSPRILPLRLEGGVW